MRQLLLQMTLWEVKGARNGETVHDQGAWERTGKVCFTGNWPVRPYLKSCLFHR